MLKCMKIVTNRVVFTAIVELLNQCILNINITTLITRKLFQEIQKVTNSKQ